ncbi:MAG: cupin domain-containing protein [Fibrobacteres bacterium]|nr:cupin domain-containing protein [Fibrobacterota bacterium]
MIKNISNSPRAPIDLEAHILHSEKPLEIVHLKLRPGESIGLHKNPFDVIFYVIEGNGTLTVEDTVVEMKSGDTTKIDSSKLRSWINDSKADLRLLVIKLL